MSIWHIAKLCTQMSHSSPILMQGSTGCPHPLGHALLWYLGGPGRLLGGPAAGPHVLLCSLRVGECLWLWHELHPGRCHEGAPGGHRGPKASGDQCLFNKGLQTHLSWAWTCWEPSCATLWACQEPISTTLESGGPGIRHCQLLPGSSLVSRTP